MDPAYARVRAFRDEVDRAAGRLEAGDTVEIADIVGRLRRACASVEPDDLGADGAMIRAQFDAMFERLEPLAAAHAGPVAADSLGLPGDARFLRDMATYLTRRFGLEEDEG
ncbi:MAG TPA: hypothetical protein VF212_09485 [Longimicrobiales bacterium]